MSPPIGFHLTPKLFKTCASWAHVAIWQVEVGDTDVGGGLYSVMMGSCPHGAGISSQNGFLMVDQCSLHQSNRSHEPQATNHKPRATSKIKPKKLNQNDLRASISGSSYNIVGWNP